MKTLQTIIAIQALLSTTQAATHSCNDRQIAAAGECFDCPTWTRAQGDHSYCGADKCDDDSILLESGECKKCDAGTKPDIIFKTKCVIDHNAVADETKPACNARQIEFQNSDGKTTCEDCPDFTRAQEFNGNWYCAAEFCQSNQITRIDGTCSDCPSGYTPDAERQQCKLIPTGSTEDYVQEEENPQESDSEEEEDEDQLIEDAFLEEQENSLENELTQEVMQEFLEDQAQLEDIDGDEDMIPDTDIDYTGTTQMPEVAPQAPSSSPPNILLSVPQEVNECGELEIKGPEGNCLRCYPYTRPQNGGEYCDSDPCLNGIVQFDGTCTKYISLLAMRTPNTKTQLRIQNLNENVILDMNSIK